MIFNSHQRYRLNKEHQCKLYFLSSICRYGKHPTPWALLRNMSFRSQPCRLACMLMLGHTRCRNCWRKCCLLDIPSLYNLRRKSQDCKDVDFFVASWGCRKCRVDMTRRKLGSSSRSGRIALLVKRMILNLNSRNSGLRTYGTNRVFAIWWKSPSENKHKRKHSKQYKDTRNHRPDRSYKNRRRISCNIRQLQLLNGMAWIPVISGLHTSSVPMSFFVDSEHMRRLVQLELQWNFWIKNQIDPSLLTHTCTWIVELPRMPENSRTAFNAKRRIHEVVQAVVVVVTA